jgi:hypothetical protein
MNGWEMKSDMHDQYGYGFGSQGQALFLPFTEQMSDTK